MADITEVLHEINYRVNTGSLDEATMSISAQLKELYKVSKAMDVYIKQIDGLSSTGSKKFEELTKSIKEADKEITNTAKNSKKFTEEDRKQLKGKINTYLSLGNEVKAVYDEILKAQIETADKEIAVREKKVENAKELAKRGNVEALKIEEDGLRRSIEQRERFAKRQQAVNTAITISNAIAAVARAALEGGGFGSIATIAALVASLAAGYAAVQSLSNENTAFAKGVVGFNGKGGPEDDRNWVRISNGESVITAEGTRNNRALLEAINKGATLHNVTATLPLAVPAFKQPEVRPDGKYANVSDVHNLEKKLDQVVDAISDNKLNQNIFFNEQGVGIITERAIRRDRNRWK
ncbi:MAG: hypothetical protein KDC07_10095 [Chitinophagaceae bacterium]|nr:hypothetical protein [Chitinophagaceae bacterium]MCB9047209.1 hypothetical protein [Chitinophagales bacterium]